jgi:hypothetical protein
MCNHGSQSGTPAGRSRVLARVQASAHRWPLFPCEERINVSAGISMALIQRRQLWNRECPGLAQFLQRAQLDTELRADVRIEENR